MEKYSSLNKQYTVPAFVYRFIGNFKNRVKNKQKFIRRTADKRRN